MKMRKRIKDSFLKAWMLSSFLTFLVLTGALVLLFLFLPAEADFPSLAELKERLIKVSVYVFSLSFVFSFFYFLIEVKDRGFHGDA